MRIIIRVYASLREKLNWWYKEFDIGEQETTIREALKKCLGDIGEIIINEFLERETKYIILLNGVNISLLQGLDTLVKEGDSIDIFPAVAGGDPLHTQLYD